MASSRGRRASAGAGVRVAAGLLSFGPGRGFCRLGFGVSAGWGSSLASGWPLSPMAGRSRPVLVPSASGAGAPSAPGTSTERHGVMRVSGGTGEWPERHGGLRVTAPDRVVARALWVCFCAHPGPGRPDDVRALTISLPAWFAEIIGPGRPPWSISPRPAPSQATSPGSPAKRDDEVGAPSIPSVGRTIDCLTFLCRAA